MVCRIVPDVPSCKLPGPDRPPVASYRRRGKDVLMMKA